jgi:hypothetical protein
VDSFICNEYGAFGSFKDPLGSALLVRSAGDPGLQFQGALELEAGDLHPPFWSASLLEPALPLELALGQ